MQPSPLIRPANATDLTSIHNLVLELAIYEKEPEAVTATIADYQRDFADGVFSAHVAEFEGKIVGATIYYLTYSTWKGKMLYLEDFVVNQSYRQLGIGQLLFDALIKTGKEMGAKLIKWQVLDWNEPALAFYRKNQAIIEKNWWNGKLFLASNQD